MSGSLFVISGPSGVGKGTLVDRMTERIPNTWVSVSATTRPPREGEVEGTHYFFLSDDEFDGMIADNGFLEWANVHTARYGTPRALVEERMAEGFNVLLEIDVQGGLQVRQTKPEAHLVFVDPPSLEELRRRLVSRGTESIDVIDARMKVAEVEIAQKNKYDYVLVNDNLEIATDKLVDYILSFAQDEKDETA